MGPNATDPVTAGLIVTPYQLHHGDADTVVLLAYDQQLSATLNTRGTDQELHVYEGYDHVEITDDAVMFERVRAWYTTYGVLP